MTAPGGDYFSATGTVQDAIAGRRCRAGQRASGTGFDPLEAILPGITVIDHGATYVTSTAALAWPAPHAARASSALIAQRPPGLVARRASAARLERGATPMACPAD